MRKSIVIFYLLFLTLISFAQDSLQKTKIEEAVYTQNALFKQEVFSVDNIPAFRVDVLKITNLERFGSVAGLRVVHKVATGKEIKTFNNYIDADEIDGLLTSLQYMKTILKSKTVPGSYTEIKYISKSGFQLMLFTVVNTQNKLDWNFMVQTNIANDKTIVALSNESIDKLQKTLEQAKGKL